MEKFSMVSQFILLRRTVEGLEADGMGDVSPAQHASLKPRSMKGEPYSPK
jgi:hypothetical protein